MRIGAVLCRHRRAVQFQRPGAPLLSARARRSWAICRSIWRPKATRERASHAIALDLRAAARKRCTLPAGTALKVVEVPPGPPVLATLLAEIYGPDAATRRAVAERAARRSSAGAVHRRCRRLLSASRGRGCGLPIDQDQLEFFGVEQRDVYDTMQALFGGIAVGYSHRGEDRNPIEIARQPAEARPGAGTSAGLDAGAGQRAARQQDAWSNSARSCRSSARRARRPIFRRDGRFADMVMAELAGAFEAPIYGMLAVDKRDRRA